MAVYNLFPIKSHGDLGFNYRQLKAETDVDAHGLDVRLAYRTAALVAAQRFPVPLSVSLRYAERFASTNNRLLIRYLGSLNLSEFVVGRSWYTWARVALDEAPLFARDWR